MLLKSIKLRLVVVLLGFAIAACASTEEVETQTVEAKPEAIQSVEVPMTEEKSSTKTITEAPKMTERDIPDLKDLVATDSAVKTGKATAPVPSASVPGSTSSQTDDLIQRVEKLKEKKSSEEN